MGAAVVVEGLAFGFELEFDAEVLLVVEAVAAFLGEVVRAFFVVSCQEAGWEAGSSTPPSSISAPNTSSTPPSLSSSSCVIFIKFLSKAEY